MKGKDTAEKVESISEEKKTKQKGREEEKEYHFCKDCRGYDKSTERNFHRKVGPVDKETGERTMIVEVRAVCRNPKSKAHGHLVMAEYKKRQCLVWEEGKYKPPTKEAEKKSEKKETKSGKTTKRSKTSKEKKDSK